MASRTTKGTDGVETPSLNELLRKLVQNRGNFAPPGWFTVSQFREKWGVKERHARSILQRMVNAKVMERKKFTIIKPKGTTANAWHYAETNR